MRQPGIIALSDRFLADELCPAALRILGFHEPGYKAAQQWLAPQVGRNPGKYRQLVYSVYDRGRDHQPKLGRYKSLPILIPLRGTINRINLIARYHPVLIRRIDWRDIVAAC